MGKLLGLLLAAGFLVAGCSTMHYEDAMGGAEEGVEAGATGSGAAGSPPDVGFQTP